MKLVSAHRLLALYKLISHLVGSRLYISVYIFYIVISCHFEFRVDGFINNFHWSLGFSLSLFRLLSLSVSVFVSLSDSFAVCIFLAFFRTWSAWLCFLSIFSRLVQPNFRYVWCIFSICWIVDAIRSCIVYSERKRAGWKVRMKYLRTSVFSFSVFSLRSTRVCVSIMSQIETHSIKRFAF